MMRLTADLIHHSAQYLNAINEFHIELRGYKISAIENLTATNDQFATIDLTDNEITVLPDLPPLRRLRTLLLANNRINRVSKDFAEMTPALENLVLTNNKITRLEEIDNLATCKTLVRLVLTDNLVTKFKNYRLYTIYKIPSLRVLDFQKVKLKERIEAKKLFEEKTEEVLKAEFLEAAEKIGVPSEAEEAKRKQERIAMLQEALKKAETLEEVNALEEMLKEGKFDEYFKDKVETKKEEPTENQ